MENRNKNDETEDNNNNNSAEAHNVAAHYNSRRDLGKRKRQESRIINLRKYNNWVKSVLIGEFSAHGQAVLDLGISFVNSYSFRSWRKRRRFAQVAKR